MNKIHLQTAQPGDHLRLVDFGKINASFRHKLLSLGITRGVEVEVIRIAPLGCPVEIEVRGTYLSLRKDEAAPLTWEKV